MSDTSSSMQYLPTAFKSTVHTTGQQYQASYYDTLIKDGQFLAALHYCEQHWGPLPQWRLQEQWDAAITLLSHLGRDRDSDALILRSFRRNPADPELCFKTLLFQLNHAGPILAEQFMLRHFVLLEQLKDASDLAIFQVCLQIRRKNFVEAWQGIAQIRQTDPDNSWLDRIELSLLRAQQRYVEEKAQAQQILQQRLKVSAVLDLARACVRNQQALEAKTLLASYAPKFQSCQLWLELVSLSARLEDWALCQHAIDHYWQLQSMPDRDDHDVLWAAQGKVALARYEISLAIDCYSKTRHPYYQKVGQNLQRWQDEPLLVRKLAVPHHRQGHLTCAPATMAALCQFWQVAVTQQEIAEQICFDGTPDTLERQWLRQHGFAVIDLELTPEKLYALIDAGLPFAMVTTSGFSSHLQAVVGYHRGLGIAWLMDPSRDDISEFQIEAGLAAEAAHGPRAMVFVPQAHAALLEPFRDATTVLYQHYDEFCQALQQHQWPQATAVLQQMQRLAAEQRLTLIARRRLAIELNDEPLIAELTLQLLERYPDEVIWISSRFFSLKNMGQTEAAIHYLLEVVRKKPHLDLLQRLFRHIYPLPAYRPQALTLLRQLEHHGSEDAATYALLADYYWQEKQYELASRYYFYACCLDDTQQDYVESYFKAAMYLKQTVQAHKRLQQRFEQYGARSASPAISLYHAYNWQSKGQAGLVVLSQARQLRPNDLELLNFSLGELLYQGQLDTFTALLEQSLALLSASQQAYWQAKKAEWQGELLLAAQYFQQCFLLTPWQARVADPYFSALNRCGQQDQIVNQLTMLAKLDASNPQFLQYQADWHPEPSVVANAVQALAEQYPHDAQQQRRYIRQLLQQGQLPQARHRCEALLTLLPDQHANRLLYAQVLQQLQLVEPARREVQRILSQDVDASGAIDLLLELSPSLEDKRQGLYWLLAQMQQQPQYGDALLAVSSAVLRQVDEQLHQQLLAILADNTHVWSCRLAWSWLLAPTDPAAALQQLQQGITDFPLLPRLHLELADLALQLQMPEQAEQSYKQALQLNPSYGRASRQLALFYENEGQLAQEIAVLEAAIRFDPFDGILHGFLADAYLRDQQMDLAQQHLHKALRFKNDYLWGWRTLQQLCLDAGEPDAALLLAQQLHQESPHLVGPLRALALLSHDPTEKVDWWLQAITLAPGELDIHLALLDYLAERGQFSQMVNHAQQYFPAAAQPFEVTTLLAKAAEQTGDPQQAIKMLSQAIAQYNPELKHWQQLFELLQAEQQSDEIRRFASLLQQRQPHDAMALCTAAEQLWSLQHHEEAMSALQQALQRAPNDRYIGLTHADFLLELNQYETALKQSAALHLRHPDVWVTQRLLKAQLGCQQFDAAQVSWQNIIQSKTEQAFLYNDVLGSFPQYAAMLLEQLLQQLPEASNMAGYCAGRWLLEQRQHSLAALLQQLPSGSAWQGPGWEGLCEAYLEHLADQEKLPPSTWLEAFAPRIEIQPELAGRLANVYRVNQRLYQAAKTYASIPPSRRPCYVSYHYAMTLLDLNRWPEALVVLEQGAQSEPDSCFHNLQLWRQAVQYVLHAQLPQDLAYINQQELTAPELRLWHYLDIAVQSDATQPYPVLLERLRQLRKISSGWRQPDRIQRVGRVMWQQLKSQHQAQPWSTRFGMAFIGFIMF